MKVQFQINGRWVDSEKQLFAQTERRKTVDRRISKDRRIKERRAECQ